MIRFTALTRRLVASAARIAAAAALVGLSSAPPTLAQDGRPADVFIGVTPTDGAPVMVYVLSDSADASIKELATYAVTISEEARTATTFDPEKACLLVKDYSLEEMVGKQAVLLSKAPVYGPNSKQKSVLAPDIGVFMSRESAKALIQNGFIANEAEVAPYFNCAGWFWARLVKQPPEFWDRTYRDLLAAQEGN